MNTLTQIKLLNLYNLTGLWKRMGALCVEGNLYRSRNWPFRLWFDPNAQEKEIPNISKYARNCDRRTIIPVWNLPGNLDSSALELSSRLQKMGFQEHFSQTAMSLDLNIPNLVSPSFPFIKAENEKDLQDWVFVNEQAFGYKIEQSVIQEIAPDPDIHLFLLKINERPAAAGMLFFHESVAGIHLVGVLSEYRKRGIAKALMQKMILQARNKGVSTCTLQASSQGFELYKKLGFKTDFVIHSYSSLAKIWQ